MNILLNGKQRKIIDFKSIVSKFIMKKKNHFTNFVNFSDTHIRTRGYVTLWALPFTFKCIYLKAKERIMETHIFHHAKI
jgi:hypothetical protein